MARPLPPALKRLGQNFLIDPNIVRKIVGAAALQPDESVLEIGPGRGALTAELCAQAARVIAVEIDPQLHAYVQESLTACANLDLRLADALEFPFDQLPPRTVVVANLPYYVSTPLLFKLLEARAQIARMVLMLQTEVAVRLAAPPGGKDYGVLSVLTQDAAEVEMVCRVSPNCFRPRPTVGSAVVRLVLRPRSTIDPQEQEAFRRVVRAAFAHRRKTLTNALRDEGYASDRIAAAIAATELPPQVRAEMVTREQYRRLAQALGSNFV